MSIVKGGTTTISSGGEFQLVPGQVTLTIANDGDGDAVTCAVTGDTGAQNYVLYRLTTATTWTAGGNRAGDGDVAIAGLDNRTSYEFVAYSIQEGSYGEPSGIVTLQVNDGGTLATQTLATRYWQDKRQRHIRTLQADTWERWYQVQLSAWDSLKPAAGDEYYDDANQIVARVAQQPVDGAFDSVWMVVTFVEISNKGFAGNYAETRRIKEARNLRVFYQVYGIALATDSAGIPARGDKLDGVDALLTPRCERVRLDDQMYPGLIVVHSTWVAMRAY